MGFILSGAGIGGLVFSPLIRALLTAIGPRWTLRALSFLNLLISLPIAITASPSRFIGRRPTHSMKILRVYRVPSSATSRVSMPILNDLALS
jgi:hypothetical protein